NALAGKPSGITAKMNALFDKEVIEALYDASQAGVPVRLIVRGICALRPGVKGLSENIQVKSVVGRFLEHSRVFHFENGGAPAIFIGSGDWMERNLRERVEVSIPIKDPAFIDLIEDILSVYWADNVKSRTMRPDGSYVLPASPAEGAVNAQEWLASRAESPDTPMPAVTRLFPLRQPHASSEPGSHLSETGTGAEPAV